MWQIEAHNMSLIQSRYGIPSHWGLLAVVFSALLVVPFFNPSMASAQEVKQIRLTEKHMQGFIAVSEDVAQLYDRASQDKPDPKLEAQAEALVKQNGFANLAEYDDVSMNYRHDYVRHRPANQEIHRATGRDQAADRRG
jgi:hypothetical protein